MTGNLKTPGEKLQEARKASGRNLADLAVETKIPEQLLVAIEMDDFHKLSGPVYVKSFLQSYARCLGLDPQEILDLYHRQSGSSDSADDLIPKQMRQELGPTKIKAPSFMPQTIAKPPQDLAEVGGDVWQEDVQVSRIGLSNTVKIQLGLILLVVVVVALAFLLIRGLRDGGDGSEGAEASSSVGEIQAEPPVPLDTGPAVPQSGTDTRSRLARLNADTLVVPLKPDASASSDPVSLDGGSLPAVYPGDSSTVFAGGRRYPLVLRLVCEQPVGAMVRWVGLSRPLQARWPAQPTPLPAEEIEAGRAYLVREGWVVFWGAEDHFDLKLDSVSGVRITLNGETRGFNQSAAGHWQLLDVNSHNQPH